MKYREGISWFCEIFVLLGIRFCSVHVFILSLFHNKFVINGCPMLMIFALKFEYVLCSHMLVMYAANLLSFLILNFNLVCILIFECYIIESCYSGVGLFINYVKIWNLHDGQLNL